MEIVVNKLKNEIGGAKRKYWTHRQGARSRKIPFLLTFEEWFKIWLESGHYHERGNRKGHYVMARKGDIGPYSSDNTKIITVEANHKERKISPEGLTRKANALKGKKKRPLSPETRAKLSATRKGKRHSPQHRANMSKAIKAWWARKKQLIN